eukprot:3401331-Rhodomonas_salina.1
MCTACGTLRSPAASPTPAKASSPARGAPSPPRRPPSQSARGSCSREGFPRPPPPPPHHDPTPARLAHRRLGSQSGSDSDSEGREELQKREAGRGALRAVRACREPCPVSTALSALVWPASSCSGPGAAPTRRSRPSWPEHAWFQPRSPAATCRRKTPCAPRLTSLGQVPPGPSPSLRSRHSMSLCHMVLTLNAPRFAYLKCRIPPSLGCGPARSPC